MSEETTVVEPEDSYDLESYTDRVYHDLLEITARTMKKSLVIIADELRPAVREIGENLRYMQEGVAEISNAAMALRETVTTQRELSAQVLDRFESISGGTQTGVRRLVSLDEGLTTLSENSSAVRQMLDSIEDIAGQLNVISINGSIQASHSGSGAAGFKVIAGEMKRMTAAVVSLADKQRERIERILEDIRDASDESDRITRDLTTNSTSLDDAVSLVEQLSRELDSVSGAAEELSATVEEFSASIEELSATIGRLADNIDLFYTELDTEVRMNDWVIDVAREFPGIAETATSITDAAQGMMRHLYHTFTDHNDERIVVMARLFVLLRLHELPESYRAELGDEVDEGSRILCLAGTAGAEPAWEDIDRSVAHKHIVLPRTAAELTIMPMLAAAFEKMDVSYDTLLKSGEGEPCMVEDYLLVPKAEGSPLIPAQEDFVIRYGIQSLLGMGGTLPSGRFFTCFIFTRIPLTEEIAEHFKILPVMLQRCLADFDAHNRIWEF